MAEMKGSDYVVTSRRPVLSDSCGVRVVEGETCERVDPRSLPSLLRAGWIKPKPKRVTKKVTKKTTTRRKKAGQ